jgi:hypothetical protein
MGPTSSKSSIHFYPCLCKFKVLIAISTIVTVRIGQPNTTVDVPVQRELISSVSLYFRSAFDGAFRETTEGVIPLTDVTEETFQIFLKWAHAQLRSPDSDVSVPDLSILPRHPLSVKTNSMVLGLVSRS